MATTMRRGTSKLDQLLEAVVVEVGNASDKPKAADRCSHCDHVIRPYYRTCPQCEGTCNRALVERLGDSIRSYRARPPRTPDEERAAEKQLVSYGHPYAAEFIRAILATPTGPGRASKGVA